MNLEFQTQDNALERSDHFQVFGVVLTINQADRHQDSPAKTHQKNMSIANTRNAIQGWVETMTFSPQKLTVKALRVL